MWNFLLGFLFARATGTSQIIRRLLWIFLLGSVVAGLIYTAVVFHALTERNSAPHVQRHSTH
jgi:hypothetical protein